MRQTLLEQSLATLACEIPGATRIFHAFNLDFCCGGQQSLREASSGRGIAAQTVADALLALQAPEDPVEDWRLAPNELLIAHILSRYHARHREQLPELIRLAKRVEQVHGDRVDCPNGLTDHLRDMQQELESHMCKEEQILFPALLEGFGKRAAAPISVLRMEHDQHNSALQRILELTDQITPPLDACNTWRALYRGLDELRSDLMQHIHLENNVLFSNALRAQPLNQA
ncbi:MAG: iron-sulfur cluster repair protein YtfE [Pseudomonas sp.]|uniref:iron-sulfur cluster repair protein YtfE n=1 Tax=Pseudomonas sp. TaxID=306 RepID=UPI003BB6F8AA